MEIQLGADSYQIKIQSGALDQVGKWLQNLWSAKKIALISDSHVFPLYGEKVMAQLTAVGFDVRPVVVPAGEKSKSLAQAEKLYEFLAEAAFTRSDAVVALGGGVVGDLTGFVASTYMRGLPFVQIPTSLLAQVDSSIGGKTAVNSSQAKNLIGTFAQPAGVLIDPETLQTLAAPQVSEGIAEIIKCALIKDRTLWQRLENFSTTAELLTQAESVITSALAVKKWAVEQDEFDLGTRLLLNFGHTIGHALENTVGYGTLSHGEAVAIGMVKITEAAEEKQLTPVGISAQLKPLVQKFGLPIDYQPWEPAKLFKAITHDKKTRGDQLKLVLLKQIGEGYLKTIPLTEMKEFL